MWIVRGVRGIKIKPRSPHTFPRTPRAFTGFLLIAHAPVHSVGRLLGGPIFVQILKPRLDSHRWLGRVGLP